MQAQEARIREQAGTWILLQRTSALSPAQRHQLQAWLAESDRHRTEYARAARLWEDMERLRGVAFPARDATYRRIAQRRRRRSVISSLAAVAAGLVCVAVLLPPRMAPEQRFVTAQGERQTVELTDGTRITLNTDTQVAVTVDDGHRQATLLRGEAYFEVKHDDMKPFSVSTQGGTIMDVGTRFNVYVRPERTEVSVTEGEVAVTGRPPLPLVSQVVGESTAGLVNPLWDAMTETLGLTTPTQHLKAGEQASLWFSGAVSPVMKMSAGAATSWLEGRIEVELMPLAEVAHELARYHPVEFVFVEPNLQDLKVTGSFHSANLATVLTALQAALPVSFQAADAHRYLIQRRP